MRISLTCRRGSILNIFCRRTCRLGSGITGWPGRKTWRGNICGESESGVHFLSRGVESSKKFDKICKNLENKGNMESFGSSKRFDFY